MLLHSYPSAVVCSGSDLASSLGRSNQGFICRPVGFLERQEDFASPEQMGLAEMLGVMTGTWEQPSAIGGKEVGE